LVSQIRLGTVRRWLQAIAFIPTLLLLRAAMLLEAEAEGFHIRAPLIHLIIMVPLHLLLHHWASLVLRAKLLCRMEPFKGSTCLGETPPSTIRIHILALFHQGLLPPRLTVGQVQTLLATTKTQCQAGLDLHRWGCQAQTMLESHRIEPFPLSSGSICLLPVR